MDERMKRVSLLQEESRDLNMEARKLLEQVQNDCSHPYRELKFEYGATTSHVGDRTHHSMRVCCQLCMATFTNQLIEYKDY